ncbi:hypothetical protein E2320_006643 [Naja naja]|nr:hypothetical protein E2320_006643 [Naja naja]
MFLKENQAHLYFLHYKFNDFLVCMFQRRNTHASKKFSDLLSECSRVVFLLPTYMLVRRRGEQFCTSDFLLREPCKHRRLDIGKECGVLFLPPKRKEIGLLSKIAPVKLISAHNILGKKKKKSEHQSIYKPETS